MTLPPMKLYFIFLFFLVSATMPDLNAQTLISFSGGPNFPGGDLCSNDTETLASGFAKTGITLDLAVEKLLYKRFGFISTLRYQRNNFDKSTLQHYGSVSADPWQSLNISIGPCYELKVSRKLFIDLFIQGGYYRTLERKLEIKGLAFVGIYQKPASTFSTSPGFAVRYVLFNNLMAGIKLDYFSARQSFKARYEVTPVFGSTIDSERAYKMDMQSLNAQVVISYRIGHDNDDHEE